MRPLILYLSLTFILEIDYMLQNIQDRLRDGLVKLEEVTKCPVCLGSVGTRLVLLSACADMGFASAVADKSISVRCVKTLSAYTSQQC